MSETMKKGRGRSLAGCVSILTLLAMFPVSTASAANCGDSVAGERVACSCGDTVVANTKLLASDPVTRFRCDDNGLRIRAARSGPSLVLDLSGLSIVGTGGGIGLHVVEGGPNGVIIEGGAPGRPAELANFRNGVRATGQVSIRRIADVVIKGSLADGLVIRSEGAEIVRVSAEGSGRDGLRIGGSGHAVSAVQASGSGRHDMRTTGRQIMSTEQGVGE
jgi:hypothetical protein